MIGSSHETAVTLKNSRIIVVYLPLPPLGHQLPLSLLCLCGRHLCPRCASFFAPLMIQSTLVGLLTREHVLCFFILSHVMYVCRYISFEIGLLKLKATIVHHRRRAVVGEIEITQNSIDGTSCRSLSLRTIVLYQAFRVFCRLTGCQI